MTRVIVDVMVRVPLEISPKGRPRIIASTAEIYAAVMDGVTRLLNDGALDTKSTNGRDIPPGKGSGAARRP